MNDKMDDARALAARWRDDARKLRNYGDADENAAEFTATGMEHCAVELEAVLAAPASHDAQRVGVEKAGLADFIRDKLVGFAPRTYGAIDKLTDDLRMAVGCAALTPAATPVPVGGEGCPARCEKWAEHSGHVCQHPWHTAQQGPVVDEAKLRNLIANWQTPSTRAGEPWIKAQARQECAHQLAAALAHPPQDGRKGESE